MSPNPNNIDQEAHIWNHCHACQEGPIIGTRYECQSCSTGPDNDLCGSCYEKYLHGHVTHPDPHSVATGSEISQHHFKAFAGKAVSHYASRLQRQQPVSPAPIIPDGFVIRPEFCSGLNSSFASYGFVIETNTATLVLTALHVMDEILKREDIDAGPDNRHQYTGKELPNIITKVNLYDLFADNWMISWITEADAMLILPNAGIHDEEPYSKRDIAAFQVSQKKSLTPGKLALKPPTEGEPVWLAVRMGENNQHRTRPAVVIEVTDSSFVYMFEDSDEGPQYTSGAPIVNSAGEVVAINVGGGNLQGRKLGHGNHVGNIRIHLSEAGISL